MQLLEYFYGLTLKNDFFRERKVQLPQAKSFHLYGARGVGKSTLVIEYLQDIDDEQWLYIDCQDPIFALEDIDSDNLELFISEEEIGILILDHYYEGFLDALPECSQTILLSREQTLTFDIKSIVLYPLDYEEFLSFERGVSPSNSFNHFLKVGTLPAVAHNNIHSFTIVMRNFFYASFDDDESRLMLILAKYQGHRITTNQIYNYAKEYFRISKDWVYRTVKRFTQEGLILFIDDIDTKGAKKMILYDFALAKYLSKHQPFPVTFDTITVLALIKHKIPFRALGVHGYLLEDNTLMVPSAFESEDSFWKKSYNKISTLKEHYISSVTIVTVSNQYSFILNDILFEALPFYEWSILNPNYGVDEIE